MMYKVWPEIAVSSELLFLNSEPEGNEICYFLLKENVNIQQNLSIIWVPFGGGKLSGCCLNYFCGCDTWRHFRKTFLLSYAPRRPLLSLSSI